MPVTKLSDWLGDWLRPGNTCYLKRLSGNDTLANQSHQAGPYIPKELLFEVLPGLNDRNRKNPDCEFDAYIDSHDDHRRVRAVWYNNRLFGGSRDEARVTNWGGVASALLDPDATGSLAAFIFVRTSVGAAITLRVWVCRNPSEEELIEDRIAPVEPGRHVVWDPNADQADLFVGARANASAASCRLTAEELPPNWLLDFPPAIEIVRKVCELRPAGGLSADERLVRRRNCEFELFQSVEEAIEGQQINRSFFSVADFLSHAQRILQRRKARSGRSLELQTRAILLEDGFIEGKDFSHQPESETGKRPDFLFPSEDAYKDAAFPTDRLRMLAAKTTCKDRWRQVINEADRICEKHLLTLQEGVSINQHAEMRAAGVRLVVPKTLTNSYPEQIRPELLQLDEFFDEVRRMSQLE